MRQTVSSFAAALLLGITLAPGPLHADPVQSLLIDGLVEHPLTLTAEDLATFPNQEVRVGYQTSHGADEATYAGVPLWTLIEKAGLGTALKSRKDRTRHYLLATAADGYQVVLSLAEIDPDLEGKPVIIALSRDGKPIDGKDRFRLALPGDRHGARNLFQLAHVEVK